MQALEGLPGGQLTGSLWPGEVWQSYPQHTPCSAQRGLFFKVVLIAEIPAAGSLQCIHIHLCWRQSWSESRNGVDPNKELQKVSGEEGEVVGVLAS